MCGIAGILDPDGVPPGETLERGRDSLTHRGPDSAGLYVNPAANVALLFRRLAIIDLSDAASQPLPNEDGTCWIVYNGEIYNFESLRSTLEQAGHRFRSVSDTEVVLHAFEQWGPDCVRRFIGMFAFAIWDERTRTLFAARDRLGIKPLYFRQAGAAFGFASELKAIVELGGRPSVDPVSVAQFLSRGYISPPRTIYEGTSSLAPAHHLTWTMGTGSPRIQRYWDPSWFRAPIGSSGPTLPEAAEELDTLLRSAIRLRLRSDVPIGAFLSGGVDSSAVVALMAAESTQRVNTFTIGFAERQYDEAPAARATAGHLRTNHHELLVDEAQAYGCVPEIAHAFDEPFADSSAVPTYLVSRLARAHVTVTLSGDGGDELFGGYRHHHTIAARLRRVRTVPRSARRVLGHLSARMSPSRAQSALGSMAVADAPEAFFAYFASIWRPPELRRLAPDLPVADADRWAPDGEMVEAFAFDDLTRYLPDDILTKVDRASMAVSLEVRVPLLDHRVVEFVLGLPAAVRMRGGLRKVLLRTVLARHVPPALMDRPKRGFGVPFDRWLRGPLAWMVREYLDDEGLRRTGVFDPREVRLAVDRFMRGEIGHARIWSLVVYQMWAQSAGRV